MKRKIGIFSFMLALVLSLSFTFGDSAKAAYSYYNSYSFTTGALWWKKTWTCKVYRDPSYYVIFYGNSKVSTGFQYKGKSGFTLSQSTSLSLSSQSKQTLNAGVDFSDFGVPVNVGGTIENTSSVTIGVSNTVQRTIKDSDPSGYYSYNICLNTTRISIDKYNSNGSYVGNMKFRAPRSQPYGSLVYNRYNADYSDAVKY